MSLSIRANIVSKQTCNFPRSVKNRMEECQNLQLHEPCQNLQSILISSHETDENSGGASSGYEKQDWKFGWYGSQQKITIERKTWSTDRPLLTQFEVILHKTFS